MTDKKTIIYASCLMSKRHVEDGLKLFPTSVGLEIQKYHRLVVEGLIKNGANVELISSHPELKVFENLQTDFCEEGCKYHYIVSKKKFFSHLDVVRRSYNATKEIIKSNKQSCVICDVLNYSVALGAVLAAKKMNVKAIGIITDFPEGSHPKGSLKIPLIWNLISRCDAYVVLTEQMTDKLSQKKKHIVVEGQADYKNDYLRSELEKYDGFTCMYAGSIHERYGIKNLVNGFLKANIPNSKLILYGNGDYSENLKTVNDDRIEYRGIASNSVVIREEQKVSLLVNPRPTNETYTLYSFPSKTIEYMASGTPLLTTKLPGIPKEYFEYMFVLEGFDSDSISKKLIEIARMNHNMLKSTGDKAREFIMTSKNNIVQTKKMLDMIAKM